MRRPRQRIRFGVAERNAGRMRAVIGLPLAPVHEWERKLPLLGDVQGQLPGVGVCRDRVISASASRLAANQDGLRA